MKKYNLSMLKIFKAFISLCLFSLIAQYVWAIETIEISGGGTKQINIAVMPYKEVVTDKRIAVCIKLLQLIFIVLDFFDP